ncbi:MAG: TerC family protein [Armatimonadota bacterium]
MTDNILPWVLFNLFVLAMLALDLGVFHRKAREIDIREALLWSLFWIALALVFNAGLLLFWPERAEAREIALEFLTGYLIEKSLSVDNIFVFVLIFNYFAIPGMFQRRVLFWGIIGALVFRAIFIATGITLIRRFDWIIYVFGVFLVVTGIKLVFEKDKELHPEKNPVLRLFRRVMPVTTELHGSSFFVRQAGRLVATPLFVVLLLIETTDIIFAVDSIPAILAVTQNPFIVYTSNVFAILGLRALYFALAGVVRMFHFLHYGLSAILVFVGIKMLVNHYTHAKTISTEVSLAFIGAALTLSIAASIRWPKQDAGSHPEAEGAVREAGS